MNQWIGGFCSDIQALFTEFREAAAGIEHGATKRIEEQERALDEATEDEDRYVESHVLNWFTEALPRVLRYSLVVSTFTAIETSLLAICHELNREKAFPLSVADLRGSGVERSRSYLTKVGGIDLGDLEADWRCLMDWQRVRHCIAHSNGEIERMNDAAQLRQAISRIAGVGDESETWSIGGNISIDSEAIDLLIQLGQSIVIRVMLKAFGPDPFGNIVVEEVRG